MMKSLPRGVTNGDDPGSLPLPVHTSSFFLVITEITGWSRR